MQTSLPANTNQRRLSQFQLQRNGSGYSLRLDFTPVGIALDQAQDALDRQVWIDTQQYMPLDTGNLKSQTSALNTTVRGKVYMFPPESDYGHYQYEGILYVDPITRKGAFYSPEYGFWSRPGVAKVPSDKLLTYSQPNAQRHWGEVAFQNHKDEWVEVVRRVVGANL